MFPLSIGSYVKIAIYTVLVCGCIYGYIEHTRFVAYREEVRITAEKQAAEVESIKKQQEITTKGIQDEYDAKLGLIRQYYANGVRNNNGSGSMPGISTASKLSDAIATYNILAGQCAETTLQTIELQKWITEQIGIK